ncbi:MAG: Asp-tRNA(Asn)/Glu-tRNA(Gln) amidotransferase subunit GatA, partial [Synergistaceae bacterium]|nr:Asp-tRNA(Asn)/Glu-tRNA(Gln) amidotransferase subunit GatA [Synergistaceae bacterium]
MELYELNLSFLVEGLKAKKFSPLEVYESCKNRIEKCEKNIHALITRTEDFAKSQLNENNNGILAGVPTILKDNLCTKGI